MKNGLHQYLDPSCLPKEYEGALPELDYTGADWYPILEGLTDHIKKWNSFGLKNK